MIRNRLVCVFAFFASSIAFGQKSTFKLQQRPEQKRFDVLINGKLFTSLLYADSLKKHVLYPVIAANGTSVTRGYPINPQPGDQIDHPHQIGIWFNYGDVNGADYWNNSTKIDTAKKAYGSIKVKQITHLKAGDKQASFTVLSTWYNPGAHPVLNEECFFVFKEINGIRFIERSVKLTALEDVLFKDNKEGLFGMRVARQLEHPSEKPVSVWSAEGKIEKTADHGIATGVYESSTGLSGEAVFASRAKWLKLSGQISGKPVSLVMFDHPQNVNFPTFLMARGYGLFAMNPLGAEIYSNGKETLNFNLKKGQSTTFRYAVVIAESLSSTEINKLYTGFSNERPALD